MKNTSLSVFSICQSFLAESLLSSIFQSPENPKSKRLFKLNEEASRDDQELQLKISKLYFVKAEHFDLKSESLNHVKIRMAAAGNSHPHLYHL